MTDNEIEKALECCIKSSHFGECFENKCPFASEEGCEVGKETLYPYLLDLINRLQAEKETFESRNKALRTERNRLNKENKKLQDHIVDYKSEIAIQETTIRKLIAECNLARFEKFKADFELVKAEIKADAYKEFADRLKKDLVYEHFFETDVVFLDKIKIDNLLKEMVGEDNG